MEEIGETIVSDSAPPKSIPDRAAIRFAAMNHLARREHSASELRDKLARRFDAPALIEEVVNKLTEEKLQSDERFAEAFVSMRMRQGKGPLRITLELQQKGVAAELREAYLDVSDREWQDLAREVRDKRFGFELPSQPKEKARQIRFLQYRGFTSEQVRALF